MVTIDNKATEEDFEEVIERDLISLNKYHEIEPSKYSLEYNLVPNQVIEYIKKTQSKNWQKLSDAMGKNAEKQLLQRLNSELSKKGIIKILRDGIKVMSTDFYFLGFKPSMSLNPELNERYENNSFGVMRQFRFNEKNKRDSIDMAIFVNGILVFTIELKNQLSGQNIQHSKDQYQERNNNTPSIRHKRVLAYFCSDTNNVAFTTKLNKKETRWFPFNRGIENPETEGYATEYLWKEVLEKDSVLELIESFSFEDKSDNIIFPRYHQRDVVLKLEDAIREEKVGNRYLIQHSTGSGKSNSIAWLAHRLSSFYLNEEDSSTYFDSIIILTNRKVLDNQISDTVSYLSQQQGVVVRTDDKSSKQLMDALETKKKIVISTIQKFLYIHNKISEIKGNFAVIIDEVHDTYSGKAYTSSLNDTIIEKNYEDLKNIDADSEEEEKTLEGEDYIVETLKQKAQPKNASYFGFTGTPKARTITMFSHNKQNISGEETNDSSKAFHSYTMKQSIKEGFTLDVLKNYTTYNTFFSFLQKNEDRLVDRNLAGKAVMDMYRGNINIEQICDVISKHFIEKVQGEINNEARAMIVTGSRAECVKYFRQINKQLAEKNANYRALVAFSPFDSEDPEITGKYGNNTKFDKIEITEEKENQFVGFTGKSIPEGLKTKEFRILVIANKYQTGYDEPLMQTMYVIKSLKNEKAVQTLSRLNRIAPFKDKTFVLDFVNKTKDIKEAFKPFYGETIMHGDIDFDSIWNHYQAIIGKQFFSEKDVSEFYSILQIKSSKSEEINKILDIALKKLIAEDEKNIKENEEIGTKDGFKNSLNEFCDVYSFFSMLPSFEIYQSSKLEKLYYFAKYLEKKIELDKRGKLDLSEDVELKNIRVALMEENKSIELEEEGLDAPRSEPSFGTKKEQPKIPLSEVLKDINNQNEGGYDEELQSKIVQVWENKILSNKNIKEQITNAKNNQNDKLEIIRGELFKEIAKENPDLWKLLDGDLQNNPNTIDEIMNALLSDYEEKALTK